MSVTNAESKLEALVQIKFLPLQNLDFKTKMYFPEHVLQTAIERSQLGIKIDGEICRAKPLNRFILHMSIYENQAMVKMCPQPTFSTVS